MPLPRKKLISVDTTSYYHCVSRCVRRAFLCGEDKHTGESYEHRREWIENRLLYLANIFAIDICAYAVMNNHYHVVLHINSQKATHWSNKDVVQQWHQLFKGNLLSQQYLKGETLGKAQQAVLNRDIKTWRERLSDISWFMKCTNEHVAREANNEENVTGRFWEGRFKSQALLDEKALMACMAYVDLNPIRAKIAKTPETSEYTSIKKRATEAKTKTAPNHHNQQVKSLYCFAGNPKKEMPEGLPFKLTDYLELVDWTGRIIRKDKKGHIHHNTPPILERLNIDPEHWEFLATQFESPFKNFVGSVYEMKKACQTVKQQWVQGITHCERLFSNS